MRLNEFESAKNALKKVYNSKITDEERNQLQAVEYLKQGFTASFFWIIIILFAWFDLSIGRFCCRIVHFGRKFTRGGP